MQWRAGIGNSSQFGKQFSGWEEMPICEVLPIVRYFTSLTVLGRDIAHHPEDWKCRGNLFEFRQWCILVHWHMGARSRGALQVCLQDGGTLLGGDLLEVDLLTATATGVDQEQG